MVCADRLRTRRVIDHALTESSHGKLLSETECLFGDYTCLPRSGFVQHAIMFEALGEHNAAVIRRPSLLNAFVGQDFSISGMSFAVAATKVDRGMRMGEYSL